jgi:hypothetical protein
VGDLLRPPRSAKRRQGPACGTTQPGRPRTRRERDSSVRTICLLVRGRRTPRRMPEPGSPKLRGGFSGRGHSSPHG